MQMLIKGRGPVANLPRLSKARLIEAIIADFSGRPEHGYTILDIGSGNGQISEYFHKTNKQFAIDIVDVRTRKESDLKFTLGLSENLPFKPDGFDIVLSHHVIEHVDDQITHLKEIHRVLKPSGLCYLATPNKSSPFMAGHKGNNKVLRLHMMKPLFLQCGFQPVEYYSKIVHHPTQFNYEIKIGRFLPMPLLEILKPLYPSQCFILIPIK
jgi:ubiquinone/menaquinone biosynthesis C-methylase UbiE